MKKRVLSLFVLVLFASVPLLAQDFSVIDVVEVSNDLTARTESRKDASGRDCALLKINVPSVKKITINEGIGDVKYLPGEFDVYVPEGIASVSLLVSGAEQAQIIDFNSFDIKITGKTVYKVTMKQIRSNQNDKGGTLFVTSNIDGPIVMIDGIPAGQLPLTVDNATIGEHVLSVPNTMGYSCPDQHFRIKKGKRTQFFLSLEESSYDLGIELIGSDNDGEGWDLVRIKKVKENGKEGLVDMTGRIIVPCDFDYVDQQFHHGFYCVENNEKWGLYKPGYGLVVDCIYNGIWPGPYWIQAKKGPNYGYLDRNCKEIVPFIYTWGTDPWEWRVGKQHELIIARLERASGDEVTGVYTKDGAVLVEPRPATQYDFQEGLSVGFHEKYDGERWLKRYFIMDENGYETLLPKGYTAHSGFFNGLLCVQNSEEKWGYMNRRGEVIIPFIYDEADDFEGFSAWVRYNGRDCFIDVDGNMIANDSTIAERFILGSNMYWHSRFLITERNKCGLMNEKREICIPVKYDAIDGDYGCYITATLDDECDVYDNNANYLFTIPSNFTIRNYDDGILLLLDEETKTYCFVNEKGEFLTDCIFSYNCPNNSLDYDIMLGESISDGMAMIILGDRFGFVDKNGNITVPPIYSSALPFENGETFVRKVDGTWIRIDMNNNILP